jgi:hypothetical protein
MLLSQVPHTAWSPVKEPIQPILIVSSSAGASVPLLHAVIIMVKTNSTLISVENFFFINSS